LKAEIENEIVEIKKYIMANHKGEKISWSVVQC
jgi:hypothetical protein